MLKGEVLRKGLWTQPPIARREAVIPGIRQVAAAEAAQVVKGKVETAFSLIARLTGRLTGRPTTSLTTHLTSSLTILPGRVSKGEVEAEKPGGPIVADRGLGGIKDQELAGHPQVEDQLLPWQRRHDQILAAAA